MITSKSLNAALVALLLAPAMMQASEKQSASKAPQRTWSETLATPFNNVWSRYGNYLGPVIGAAAFGGLMYASVKNDSACNTTLRKATPIVATALVGGYLGHKLSSENFNKRITFKKRNLADTGWDHKYARFFPAIGLASLAGLAAVYSNATPAKTALALGGGVAVGLITDKLNVVEGLKAGAIAGAAAGYAYGRSAKSAAVGAVGGAVLGALGQRPASRAWAYTRAYLARRRQEAHDASDLDSSPRTSHSPSSVSSSSSSSSRPLPASNTPPLNTYGYNHKSTYGSNSGSSRASRLLTSSSSSYSSGIPFVSRSASSSSANIPTTADDNDSSDTSSFVSSNGVDMPKADISETMHAAAARMQGSLLYDDYSPRN